MAVLILRLSLFAGSAALIAWSASAFHDAEGLFSAMCLPAAAAVALAINGLAVGSSWLRSTLWFGVLLVGQAAALQWIDAGKQLHYQHYRPLSDIANRPMPLLLIGIQALLVGVALRGYIRPLGGWLRAKVSVPSTLLILAAVAGVTAAASRIPAQFATDLALGALTQAVAAGNLVLAAAALPECDQWKKRLARWLEPARPGPDRLVLAAGVFVAVTAGVLSYFVYERHPHVEDEAAYYMQARLLAIGAVDLPAPPVPEAQSFFLMDSRGDRWFPATPPGWPVFLAAGTLLGLPWLVNPILGGLSVLLAGWLLEHLYDPRTARIGVLLLATSPWHIFLAMSLMTHTSQMFTALVAVVGVAKAASTFRWPWAFAGGAGLGLTSLNRPLDGAILGLLLAAWALGLGAKRLRFPCLAALAMGTILTASLVLPFNQRLTGSPFAFPLSTFADKHFGPGRNALGFGKDRGLGWALDPFPGHGPLDALVNLNLNGHSVNTELLGWPTGSVLIVAIALFARPRHRSDRLLLAAIVAVCGVYSLYWFSGGPDFGARYWFLTLLPCIALAARGVLWVSNESGHPWRVQTAVLALCGFTLVNYLPWRSLDKYHHYLGMRPDVRDLAASGRLGRSLVLIRGKSFPDFVSAAPYNPLDPRDPADPGPLFAWDKDPHTRERLLQAYPDRPVWIVNGPSITGLGYEIESGPR